MANSLDYLRQALGPEFASYNDEALIRLAADSTGADPMQIAQAYGVGADRGKTGSRFSSAIDSYQANMYGLGEAATGADWFRRGREENELSAAIANKRARDLGAVESWDQVHGIGDFGDYAAGLAIQSSPYLAEAAVGGLAARGLSTGLRAAGSAAREMGMSAAEQQIAKQLAQRSALGGAVASYPSAVGDILSNQREQLSAQGLDAGGVDLTSAAIGGVPYAALNYFSPAERIAAGGGAPRLARALDSAQGVTGGLKRMGANAAILGAGEGFNEMGQEGLNQYFGRMAVDPNATMTSGDALDRYKESFIGGATLGGLMGGGVGGWKRSEKWYEDQAKQLRDAQSASRLEQGGAVDLVAPPGELDLQGGETAPAYSPLFNNGAGVIGGPVMATTQMRDAGIDTQAAAERRNELLREKQEAIHNLNLIEQQYGKSDIFYTALQGIYPRIDAIDKEVEQIERHLARYGDQGVQGQQEGLDFSEPGSTPTSEAALAYRALGLQPQSGSLGQQQRATSVANEVGGQYQALGQQPQGYSLEQQRSGVGQSAPIMGSDGTRATPWSNPQGPFQASDPTQHPAVQEAMQSRRQQLLDSGAQQAQSFAKRVSELGLDPNDKAHQAFVKELDKAVSAGVVSPDDAVKMAGMVRGGVAPSTVLTHHVKPKLKEAEKAQKAQSKYKDTQGANLRTAIAEREHGMLDDVGVLAVREAVAKGHDGTAALKAARNAFNERKKAAAKEAADAKKLAEAKAAMAETTPATDKKSTKPAPIVVPSQPTQVTAKRGERNDLLSRIEKAVSERGQALSAGLIDVPKAMSLLAERPDYQHALRLMLGLDEDLHPVNSAPPKRAGAVEQVKNTGDYDTATNYEEFGKALNTIGVTVKAVNKFLANGQKAAELTEEQAPETQSKLDDAVEGIEPVTKSEVVRAEDAKNDLTAAENDVADPQEQDGTWGVNGPVDGNKRFTPKQKGLMTSAVTLIKSGRADEVTHEKLGEAAALATRLDLDDASNVASLKVLTDEVAARLMRGNSDTRAALQRGSDAALKDQYAKPRGQTTDFGSVEQDDSEAESRDAGDNGVEPADERSGSYGESQQEAPKPAPAVVVKKRRVAAKPAVETVQETPKGGEAGRLTAKEQWDELRSQQTPELQESIPAYDNLTLLQKADVEAALKKGDLTMADMAKVGSSVQFSKSESPEVVKLRSDIDRYTQLLACLTR